MKKNRKSSFPSKLKEFKLPFHINDQCHFRTNMGTILGSSVLLFQYGLSGTYWYSIGGGVQVMLFSYLGYAMKIRAPGAKTICQFIGVEYGKKTHILFITICLFQNFVTFAALLVEATVALNAIVDDLRPEFSSMLLALLIGGYTIVGGLGGTFYVCYANTVLLFFLILLLQIIVYLNPAAIEQETFGNISTLYELVECWDPGHTNSSLLQFGSDSNWKFGFTNFFYSFGSTFLDQGVWQGVIAAKPADGAVFGFIGGALVWMAIALGLGTTSGVAYAGLCSSQGFSILADEEVNSNLILPLVTSVLMGSTGSYLLFIIMLLAVMTTGSGQVIAISSIIVYDIYIPYIQPYRKHLPTNYCLICQKKFENNSQEAFKEEVCDCVCIKNCLDCGEDEKSISKARKSNDLVLPHYKCEDHKDFRVYEETMLKFSSWVVVVTTLSSVPIIWPLTSIGNSYNINLANIFVVCNVFINGQWIPLTLAILWSGTKPSGLIAGNVFGSFFGLLGWLITATTDQEGLTLESAASQDSILVGSIVAMTSSLLITVVVSLVARNDPKRSENWEKTLNIVNPLTPWVATYAKDLGFTGQRRYIDLPSADIMKKAFRIWGYIALGSSIVLTFILLIVIPLSLETEAFSLTQFHNWTNFCVAWTIFATCLGAVLPSAQLIYEIYFEKFKKKTEDMLTLKTPISLDD